MKERGSWARTTFGAWAKGYGIVRLVEELTWHHCHPITAAAIYQWLWGMTRPRTPTARMLVRIAGGAITLDDIYDHRDAMRAAAKPSASGEAA